MSSRLYKCYGTCGEKHPKENLVNYKGTNYCTSCYEIKTTDEKEREILYNMLKEIFQLSFPTGLMLRQVKQYKEERGYSYKNIRFAVDYLVNIKRTKLQMQFGIALVPHVYDEMISYYKDLQEKRSKVVYEKPKIVKISMKADSLENEYKKTKLVDMSKFMNSEEE